MKESSVSREDIFFTSKLMHNKLDPQGVVADIKVSLQKAGLDYLDL